MRNVQNHKRGATTNFHDAYSLKLTREGVPVPAWFAWSHESETETESGSERNRTPEWLHPAESARLALLSYPLRRRSFLLGRLCAKRAAAPFLPDLHPSSIEIASGVFGQPFIRCCEHRVPELSLSHSGALAASVTGDSGHPMGIDLERIDPSRQRVLLDLLSPEEFALFRAVGVNPIAGCWHLWTIKEALSKALRCGLTIPWSFLALSELRQDPHECFHATFTHFGQFRAVSWRLQAGVLSLALPRRTEMQFHPRNIPAPPSW